MFTRIVCLGGGFGIGFVITIQIYLKLSNAEEELASQTAFAILLLAWGEMIVIFSISTLATLINDKEWEIRYLMNQMFRYHTHYLMPWLNQRDISLDIAHKKKIIAGGAIILGSGYISYLFPFILLGAFFHPLEPVHNIALEWLEWNISLETLTTIHIVFFPGIFIAASAAANTIITIVNLITCYFLIATLAIEDMTPVRVAQIKSTKYASFETNFYGVLSDEEIIQNYRVQQLFYLLINDIVASLRVSLHHVALLASPCIMAYFAIKFSSVVKETGLVGHFIIGMFIMVPILIEFLEAKWFGTLVDISENFKDKCSKLTGRRKLMKVFSRSCATFYVKQAYPFFTISKETFLEFMGQVVDKTITLLLW